MTKAAGARAGQSLVAMIQTAAEQQEQRETSPRKDVNDKNGDEDYEDWKRRILQESQQ